MKSGKELRKEKLKLRDGLSEEELSQKSKIIEERIFSLDELERAKNIFVYVSFRSEVNTLGLIEKLMNLDKKISVPITYVKEKRMDAILIEDLSKDLVPGYCGIMEPKEEIRIQKITEPQNIDVVIIPGSVFDRRGGRFGYGGGYYDRFLEKIPYAVRIGLAFDLQLVDEAPIQPHDEILDFIITEEDIFRINRI